MTFFCDRIKEERKRLGLTQEQVAQLTNKTVQSQRSYESGKRMPDIEYLSALDEAGFNTGYILTGEHQPDPSLLDLPSFERGIEVSLRVLEVTGELGVNPGREGITQICLYAHKYCPTKEGLKAYIESAYALLSAVNQEPANDAHNNADEESVPNEEPEITILDVVDLDRDKKEIKDIDLLDLFKE
ncbi:MAG: helix-turn-helix domain-containing protein [Methylobacter sp.]